MTGPANYRTPIFYTIGHSTLKIDDFIHQLNDASINLLIDVRRLPGSKKYPQYNKQPLCESLNDAGIEYLHLTNLAGRRKQQDIDSDINNAWQNQSFHNYADYALGPEFKQGLDKVIELGASHTVAIMCAESVWWRCHRRIITDYLIAEGYEVRHIIGGRIQRAQLTDFAQPNHDGSVTYPEENT